MAWLPCHVPKIITSIRSNSFLINKSVCGEISFAKESIVNILSSPHPIQSHWLIFCLVFTLYHHGGLNIHLIMTKYMHKFTTQLSIIRNNTSWLLVNIILVNIIKEKKMLWYLGCVILFSFTIGKKTNRPSRNIVFVSSKCYCSISGGVGVGQEAAWWTICGIHSSLQGGILRYHST